MSDAYVRGVQKDERERLSDIVNGQSDQIQVLQQRAEAAERKLATIRQLALERPAIGYKPKDGCMQHWSALEEIAALAQIEQPQQKTAPISESKHKAAIAQFGTDAIVDHVFRGMDNNPPKCELCGCGFSQHARVPSNMLISLDDQPQSTRTEPQSAPAEREEPTDTQRLDWLLANGGIIPFKGEYNYRKAIDIAAGWRKAK